MQGGHVPPVEADQRWAWPTLQEGPELLGRGRVPLVLRRAGGQEDERAVLELILLAPPEVARLVAGIGRVEDAGGAKVTTRLERIE